MTCSIIMLVMVAIGINSALVMVALVLNRTTCRRPGSRDNNYSYRPSSLDGDICILRPFMLCFCLGWGVS